MKTKISCIPVLTLIAILMVGCSTQPHQSIPIAPSAVHERANTQLEPMTVQPGSNLKLVVKEYTIEDLKRMNISCVKVYSPNENITYTRGGDTFKFSYYQVSEGAYPLTTASYGDKIYLQLERPKLAVSNEPQRAIQVTLPENYGFYRLYAGTASGTILFHNCNITALKTVHFESGYYYDGDDESDRTKQGTAEFTVRNSL